MSRVDKGVKIEVERESLLKVDIIREADECPVVDLATCAINEGDKTPWEGTDGEMNDDKTETEDTDKTKEDSNKDKKIWMEYTDFCKCFRSGNFTVCSRSNSCSLHGFTLITPRIKTILL